MSWACEKRKKCCEILSPYPLNKKITNMLGIGMFGISVGVHKLMNGVWNRGHTFRSAFIGGKLKPPVAKKKNTTVYFGKHPDKLEEYRGPNPMSPPISVEDPYFWMRDDDRKCPEVLRHLEAENRYCEQGMKPLLPLQKVLYDEMVGHMKETDEDAPYTHGPYLYYSKSIKGKAYKIHCRKVKGKTDGASDGPEEVILDENNLAEGKAHCVVGSLQVSPDHSYLAYSVDFSGYETFTIRFLNLSNMTYLPDVIEDTDGSLEWGRDGTVFYVQMDDAHRSCEVWAHSIVSLSPQPGAAAQQDVCIRKEDDGVFNVGIGKTQDDQFLVLASESSETSEQYILDLSSSPSNLEELSKRFVLVAERQFGVRYELEHHEGKLLIVTNKDGAKSNKLCVAMLGGPQSLAQDVRQENWRDVRPYDASTQIQYVLPFHNHIAVVGRHGGLRQVWVVDTHKGLDQWQQITFPEPIYGVWLKDNYEYNTSTLRLMYSSFVTPKQTMDYDMSTAQSVVVKQQEVPGYDRSLYETRRLFATARDGMQVPMSLVAKKSVLARIDSNAAGPGAPLLLDGYGSYGFPIDTAFDYKALSLLDRDIVYCVAHIRGGGEMGKQWHEEHGKYLKKVNTFNDFADCAKHLISAGYTSSDRLGITGRSAGGLLMGAVVNRDPHLYKACVAAVPFVDVIVTMCDPSIPLTTGEWEEWGNPNEAKFFEYMKSYSPVDNVVAQRYPSMLITGGLFDPRVAYWEPAKWVAKLREFKTNDDDTNPIFFKTDMSTGHFSASDRYAYMRERSIEYSFLIDQLTPAAATTTTTTMTA